LGVLGVLLHLVICALSGRFQYTRVQPSGSVWIRTLLDFGLGAERFALYDVCPECR